MKKPAHRAGFLLLILALPARRGQAVALLASFCGALTSKRDHNLENRLGILQAVTEEFAQLRHPVAHRRRPR